MTDNLPPSCAVVVKSGNLNFLEPSGPVQACNGTDLPLFTDKSKQMKYSGADGSTTHDVWGVCLDCENGK